MKRFTKIYLIDDDAIINFMNKKILVKGAVCDNILLFSNAEAVLEDIVQAGPGDTSSLILLDINMPGMDGWEFLQEFEKLNCTIISDYKIVMLSSSISIDDIEKSKKYKPVQGFISKPFTLEKLNSLAF